MQTLQWLYLISGTAAYISAELAFPNNFKVRYSSGQFSCYGMVAKSYLVFYAVDISLLQR